MNRFFSRYIFVYPLLAVLFGQLTAQENPARDRLQQPEKIMDVIGVTEGMTIGEVGAGRGYFTFKLARRVGDSGIIYANDINQDKLEEIADYCDDHNIQNVKTLKGQTADPLFPAGQMDMVVMMHVFHDLTQPVEFLENTKAALKPKVNVVIIDQDPEKYDRYSSHFMKKKDVIEKIESAGYELIKIETFLAHDNIYICRPAESYID